MNHISKNLANNCLVSSTMMFHTAITSAEREHSLKQVLPLTPYRLGIVCLDLVRFSPTTCISYFYMTYPHPHKLDYTFTSHMRLKEFH